MYYKSDTGLVFSLGIEVSPVRFLPSYCYYPFDLADRSNRAVLEGVIERGLLRCSFRSGTKSIDRDIRIPDSELSSIATLYKQALADLEAFKGGKPNFRMALAELERADILPTHFARVFSENEFHFLAKTIRQEAERIAPEKRALSQKLIQGIFDVAKTRYPKDFRFLLDSLTDWICFVQLVSDLYRHYREDYAGIVQFAADVAAASLPDQELEQMAWLPEALNSLCELIEQLRSEPQTEQQTILPRVVSLFAAIRSRLRSGHGLSQDFLRSSIAVLGPQVRGKPGRKPGDLSWIDDLRKAGRTWKETTRIIFESEPSLRGEFGVQAYDDLTPEQRIALQHRLEERYGNYRRRIPKTIGNQQSGPA